MAETATASASTVLDGAVVIPGHPPKQFTGHLLGEVSTQTWGQPRWLEISLYKVTDSTGGYVLHRCGASVVYHEHGGPCNTGVPTAESRMPLDAEACKVCQPGTVAGGAIPAVWDLEQDRYTTHRCRDAQEVVARLRKPKGHDGGGGTLSAPAQRLLDLVAPVDAGVAAVVRAVEAL